LAANEDGSWQILGKSDVTTAREDGGEQMPAEEGVTWSRATVYPDGHQEHIESTGQGEGVPFVVKLPASADELKHGWVVKDDSSATRYTAAAGPSGTLMIHSVHSGLEDPIYLATSSGDVTFDGKKGFAVREADASSQGYGFVGKSTGETSLEKVETVAPALDWKTTDLKGASHALADYRGKVVVLDFWNRGCGWCMLAMPQVKEAAAHFAGRPVAFLAMSTDAADSRDADFVVEKMAIPYPTLHADEVAKAYNVNSFPTLLVLDQKGVVRTIHSGYTKDLREKLEASVDALLKQEK
jgi:thiol-disulfide isomerase/thioredoxin